MANTFVKPLKQTPHSAAVYVLSLCLAPFLNASALAQPGLEGGLDRPGHDIQRIELGRPDPLECDSRCVMAPYDCVAFTYVKPSAPTARALCYLKNRVPAPVKNECCISGVLVPSGTVLAFRNLQNQSDFPNPENKALKARAVLRKGCDANGTGWQWYQALSSTGDASEKPDRFRLPPGLVYRLTHSGVECRADHFLVEEYDKRKIGNWGGSVGCKSVNRYLNVCHGGDIGAPEHIGYYWLESTGADFDEWSTVLGRLPPYAVIGLKHSVNQPQKTLTWNGQRYDPANLSQPPPPGLVRMHGGDQGAACDEGYYWYEVNIGQPVWTPECKSTEVPPERPLRTFQVSFMRTAPASGGTVYYYGTVTAPGNLVSVSNVRFSGLGKEWIVMFPKAGKTTNDCSDPNATVKIAPGESTNIFEGLPLYGGLFLGFCLSSTDQYTLGAGWPESWALNITWR